MKSNINRRQEIFKGVLPPKGTKAYLNVLEAIRQREIANPEMKSFSKKSWEKVTRSLEAQDLSNCGLICEKSLRHYLKEFNNRAWAHGLRSMPLMFNIMEAFFRYRKPEVYFELIEEENYLISFFDFIDFVTSNEFTDGKSVIDENLTPEIIYNFNVGQDLEGIKFSSEEKQEFIVAGVSIIRRENEVTVLMTTGRRKADTDFIDKSEFRFSTDNPQKADLINEIKETLRTTELEFEYLDQDRKYIKVLIAARMDLETMTIDARYLAEETNLMFNIATDEVDGFLDGSGKFASNDLKEAYESSKEKIEGYGAIFEAIQLSVYLPYYFNLKEDAILEEVLDTEFKSKYSSPLTKRKYSNVFGFKASTKSLYTLDTHGVLRPDAIKLRDDLFKIQTSGYWKKLGIDKVGSDKTGKPIHGRTWVNQTLSWFQAKERDLLVEKEGELYRDPNAGYIYILRNPTMERNIFKIGLTRYNVEDRVNQLSKTSVPDRFYKSQEWNVKDCIKAEAEIHKRLEDYRVDPRREFFKIDYDKAISVIKNVVDSINEK